MRNAGRAAYILVNMVLISAGAVIRLIGQGSIGDNILASGVVGLILFWALEVTRTKEAAEERLLADAMEQGIVRVYDRRLMPDQYAEVRRKASGAFDMMGFGLRTFIEDNRESLQEWAETFTFRLLVVHPDSQYCEQRDREERDPPGKIRDDVHYITKVVQGLNNPRIRIRWYTALPVTNLFRMGDTMFVGPYFVDTRSRNSMTLKLKAGGKLFDRYLERFDRVWTDDKLSVEPPNLL